MRPDGFDVHDDGPGFPPDFVDHAFERFARVDAARERSGDRRGGAGLGLSLVEAIVRSHGGTVTLASAPGWHHDRGPATLTHVPRLSDNLPRREEATP